LWNVAKFEEDESGVVFDAFKSIIDHLLVVCDPFDRIGVELNFLQSRHVCEVDGNGGIARDAQVLDTAAIDCGNGAIDAEWDIDAVVEPEKRGIGKEWQKLGSNLLAGCCELPGEVDINSMKGGCGGVRSIRREAQHHGLGSRDYDISTEPETCTLDETAKDLVSDLYRSFDKATSFLCRHGVDVGNRVEGSRAE
jgi:hypothetical protein